MHFINEHKSFIFTLLGGAAVFFICMYLINGIFDQARDIKEEIQSKEGQVEKQLEKLKSPSKQKGLKYQRSVAPVLEKDLLPELEKSLVFEASSEFQWKKKDGNPSFDFSTKKAEVSRDLTLLADKNSFSFPDLGFSKTNINPAEAQEYFARLEIVKRIVTYAILSGLKKINNLNSELESKVTPIPGTSKGIRRVPFKFSLVGENQALLQFLSGFGKKGTTYSPDSSSTLPPMELEDLVITPSENSKFLILEIRLSALSLSTLEKKAEEEGDTEAKKQPWGSRSWIRRHN